MSGVARPNLFGCVVRIGCPRCSNIFAHREPERWKRPRAGDAIPGPWRFTALCQQHGSRIGDLAKAVRSSGLSDSALPASCCWPKQKSPSCTPRPRACPAPEEMCRTTRAAAPDPEIFCFGPGAWWSRRGWGRIVGMGRQQKACPVRSRRNLASGGNEHTSSGLRRRLHCIPHDNGWRLPHGIPSHPSRPALHFHVAGARCKISGVWGRPPGHGRNGLPASRFGKRFTSTTWDELNKFDRGAQNRCPEKTTRRFKMVGVLLAAAMGGPDSLHVFQKAGVVARSQIFREELCVAVAIVLHQSCLKPLLVAAAGNVVSCRPLASWPET